MWKYTYRVVSFEWSLHRILSTDSKVRATSQNPIIHSGIVRVKMNVIQHSFDAMFMLLIKSVGGKSDTSTPFLQDLRCSKMLHVGTPFAHDVNICQFCSMRRGAFGEMSLLNKDSCFICGRFATWKDDRHAAMVCNFHKPPPGPPKMKMCFLCRKPAFQNAWKVYLCPFCGMGMKRCAMLVGE